MSAIVFTERGGACGICLEGFSSGQKQYTHEGGKHDGFHKNCLKEWLNIQRKCPYDGQNIDPNSLTSRTEKVVRILKEPLENAAYAIAIGGLIGGCVATIAGAVGAVGAVGGVGAVGAVGALVVVAAGTKIATGALGGAERAGALGGALEVVGRAAVALGLVEVVGRAAVALGLVERVGALAATVGLAGGLILGDCIERIGDCIERILERRGVDVSARAIIGYAISAGGLATAELAEYADPIRAIIGGSLTGGCVAGILSMLKPYFRR